MILKAAVTVIHGALMCMGKYEYEKCDQLSVLSKFISWS